MSEDGYFEKGKWVEIPKPISDLNKLVGKLAIRTRSAHCNKNGHNGVEIDLDWKSMLRRCHEMAVKYVPEIHTIILESKETLMQSMDKYVNRESYITPAHIMEGVVVRVDGSHWKAFKYKSFNFKVLEGIIKDTGVADLEETA
jgi:hypothetical protein